MSSVKDDFYYRELRFALYSRVDLGRNPRAHSSIRPFIGDVRLKTTWRDLEGEYPIKFYYLVTRLHEAYPKTKRFRLLHEYLISWRNGVAIVILSEGVRLSKESAVVVHMKDHTIDGMFSIWKSNIRVKQSIEQLMRSLLWPARTSHLPHFSHTSLLSSKRPSGVCWCRVGCAVVTFVSR